VKEGFSEDNFLKFLPPLEIAQALLDILYLLSSVYYTRLGDYGNDYFTDPVIQNHLAEFQQELLKIENKINERTRSGRRMSFCFHRRFRRASTFNPNDAAVWTIEKREFRSNKGENSNGKSITNSDGIGNGTYRRAKDSAATRVVC
jgi:hypothetical protein